MEWIEATFFCTAATATSVCVRARAERKHQTGEIYVSWYLDVMTEIALDFVEVEMLFRKPLIFGPIPNINFFCESLLP